MLKYVTSGESHGSMLLAMLEGMVAGLRIDEEKLAREMARRQAGYGRGGRMQIEKDAAEIVSGVRFGETIGSPIGIVIRNNDFKINELPVVKRPRPGHADLVGAIKYDRRDVRDILERASARETAARVAIGGICRQFLESLGVDVLSHVVEIGGVRAPESRKSFEDLKRAAEASPVRCADSEASARMVAKIDEIKKAKDTVGGVFEIRVKGVPPGLGSYTHSDARLDARIGAALLSIQAVKGVEFGLGFAYGAAPGSLSHDEIEYNAATPYGFMRQTNRAGGIEGSMSNGETLVVRAVAKPYATLMKPMRSVHLDTKAEEVGTIERSDVTAVPACGVVGEAMVCFELAKVFLEKFGGDSLGETSGNFKQYIEHIRSF